MSEDRVKKCTGCGAEFHKRPKGTWDEWRARQFCSVRCASNARTSSPVSDRLWARVEKEGHHGCWIWTGATIRGGYGVIGRPGGRRAGNILTHVAAYLELVGPIPEGYQVDHLCRVTPCCNPEHLEAVTQAENLRRQQAAITHCIRGHEFTPANTYTPPGTAKRQCRECIQIRGDQMTDRRRSLRASSDYMTEAQLQSAVLDLTKWLGLMAFHSTDSRRDSCAGFPDLVISGSRGVLMRELKSPLGRLRPEQLDWLSRLTQGGADAAIWRPADLASGRIKTELEGIR